MVVKAQIARSAHLLALIDVHLVLIEHCICCNPSKLINGKSLKTSGITIEILVEMCCKNSRVICQKVTICQQKIAWFPRSIILDAKHEIIVGNNQDFFYIYVKDFYISKKYSKSLSWAKNLNIFFTVMGGKFKFSAEYSELGAYCGSRYKQKKNLGCSWWFFFSFLISKTIDVRK